MTRKRTHMFIACAIMVVFAISLYWGYARTRGFDCREVDLGHMPRIVSDIDYDRLRVPEFVSYETHARIFSRFSPHFTLTVSPNSSAVAYVEPADGGAGEWHFRYTKNPHSLENYYTGPKEGKCRVVVNGKKGKLYDAIGRDSLLFSADGEHVAYGAKFDGNWHVVASGEEGPGFDAVNDITFSSDGKRLAYGAKRGDAWHIVIDRVAGEAFDQVGRPVYCRNGTEVAYRARRGNKWYLVTSNDTSAAFDDIEEFTLNDRFYPAALFSPSGEHFAFVARRGDEYLIIMDGRELGKAASAASSGYDIRKTMEFSSNSNAIAYAIGPNVYIHKDNGVQCYTSKKNSAEKIHMNWDGSLVAVVTGGMVSVNGVELGEYDSPSRFVISPDGKRYAFVTRSGRNSELEATVVLDGVQQKPSGKWLHEMAFSDDGRHFYYVAAWDGKAVAVLDGKSGTSYDEVREPLFTRDGGSLLYAARSADTWKIVTHGSGEVLPLDIYPYDLILARTPGHFICSTKRKGPQTNALSFPLYVDGRAIRSHFVLSLAGDRALSESSPGHYRVLTRRGEEICRLDFSFR